MTPTELIAFGIARHGKKGWIGKLAKEIGYSHSQVYRAAHGDEPISRRMELEIKNLEPNKKTGEINSGPNHSNLKELSL